MGDAIESLPTDELPPSHEEATDLQSQQMVKKEFSTILDMICMFIERGEYKTAIKLLQDHEMERKNSANRIPLVIKPFLLR